MGFVVAALCGVALTFPQSKDPLPIAPGFGISVTFSNFNLQELNLLKASGAKYVKRNVTRGETRRDSSGFDFTSLKDFASQMKRFGITPMLNLQIGSQTNAEVKSWANSLASSLKDTDVVFEISCDDRGDLSDYSKAATDVAEAIKGASPIAKVVVSARTGFSVTELKQWITKPLVSRADAIGLRPLRDGGPESIVADLAAAQDIVRTACGTERTVLPVILSEWGYSLNQPGMTLGRQAMYVAKLHPIAAAYGSPITILKNWRDGGSQVRASDDRYGLISTGVSQRPSYDAFRLVNKAFDGCTTFVRMQKKDPLDWVIVGASPTKMVRISWYQRTAGMPKFEAYDMRDRANQKLLASILRGELGTPPVDATPRIIATNPPKTNPPKTNPPQTQRPPVNTGPLTISYAPPLDNEGWMAVIENPTGSQSKIEFRYNRRDTGAKVTCFAAVRSERMLEPLATSQDNFDFEASISGRPAGISTVTQMPVKPLDWLVKYEGEVTPRQYDERNDYTLLADRPTFGVTPVSPVEIPADAKKLVLWVKTDFTGNELVSTIKDEQGNIEVVPLCVLDNRSDRNGWKAVVIPLDKLTKVSGRKFWEMLVAVKLPAGNPTKSGTLQLGTAAYEL